MPVTVTYPGVYIQEIPSGSHTISGVATSITAFMGRAVCGPLGQADQNGQMGGPITIFSFQDYQNIFGGLSHDSPMSYAVRDFFINGGSQAVIVRLFEGYPGNEAASTATFYADAPPLLSPPNSFASPPDFPSSPPAGGLELMAANPGKWGNYLLAQVDFGNPNNKLQIMQKFVQYGVTPPNPDGTGGDPLFNLTVYYNPPSGIIQSERFTNLMVTGDKHNPNRIDNVLKTQSMLVRAAGDYPDKAGPNPLSAYWAAGWQAFNDDVASTNPSQTQLLAALPGPNSLGTAAASDSDVISPATFVEGQKALDQVDLFNLLCIPADYANDTQVDDTLMDTAAQMLPYCGKRRAMMILDPLSAWSDHVKVDRWDLIQPTDYNLSGDIERNAAVYFPRVIEADPLKKNQPTDPMSPIGIIAGVIATTDLTRGVWKAPAGIDAGVNNILQLEYKMTNDQNGMLNPLGINCLRTFPVIGSVVWGARTLRGADELEDDYKYLNVRRLTLYVEESLYRGTQWAVFEPNDSVLWGSLTTSINAFLAGLQRQGAFYSYFVQCDATTTTPTDIDLGIVNIMVGIAPVKPAEFVVISIQQQALQPSS